MTAMCNGSMRAPLSMFVLALLVALPLSASSAEDVRATIVQQKSGTQATLMGVYFRNAAVGWAVGAGGTLLKTVDAGRKWKKVPSGTSSLLTAVLFVDDRWGGQSVPMARSALQRMAERRGDLRSYPVKHRCTASSLSLHNTGGLSAVRVPYCIPWTAARRGAIRPAGPVLPCMRCILWTISTG